MNDFNTDTKYSDSLQEDLLNEIEVRCHTNVAAVRQSTSQHTRVRVAVQVRAGNACDRQHTLTKLQTSELSALGLTGIATLPVMVGSIFHLQFDRAVLDAPPALAICDRCMLLGDDSFELRFRFVQAIDLSSAAPAK